MGETGSPAGSGRRLRQRAAAGVRRVPKPGRRALVPWAVAGVVIGALALTGVQAVRATEDSSALDRYAPTPLGATWVYATTNLGKDTGANVEQVVAPALAGQAESSLVVRSRWENLLGNGPSESFVYLARRDDEIVDLGDRGNDGFKATEPPQPALRLPLREGAAWKWTGTDGDLKATFEFEIDRIEPYRALGRMRSDCAHVVVVITYSFDDGSKVRSDYDEWRCPGIGVVYSREHLPSREIDVVRTLAGYRIEGRGEGVAPPTSESTSETAEPSDTGRSNWFPDARPPADGIAWQLSRATPLGLPPAGDATTLVLVENDGTVSSVDRRTGDVRWRIRIAEPVVARPVLGTDAVFVADGRKNVLALDRATGAARWIARLPDVVTLVPLLLEGRLVVLGEDRRLRALSVDSGRTLWSVRLASRARTAPILAGGVVVADAGAGRLVAVAPSTGRTVWETELDDVVDQGPATAGGLVVVADAADAVYGVDARTGEIRWQRAPDDGVSTPFAITDDTIAFVTDEDEVQALDARNGRERWRADPDGDVRVPPLVAGDSVLALTRDARLRTFALADGADRATRELAPPEPVNPANAEVFMTILGDELVVHLGLADPWPSRGLVLGLAAGDAAASGPTLTATSSPLPAGLGYPTAVPVAAADGLVVPVRDIEGTNRTWLLPSDGDPVLLAESTDTIEFAIPGGDTVFTRSGSDLVAVPLAGGGAPKWKLAIGSGGPGNGPALVDDVLVVPLASQGLVGVDAGTGRRLWSAPLPNVLTLTRPVRVGGDVVYASGAAARIDARTGEVRWRVPGLTATGPVAVAGGMVFVAGIFTGGGSEQSIVAALGLADGSIKWVRPFNTAIALGVTANDDAVVVADATGLVLAYNPASGEPRWSRKLRTPPSATPAILGSSVAVLQTGRSEDALDRDHELTVFDLRTGGLRAAVELPGSAFHFPGAAGGSGVFYAPSLAAGTSVLYRLSEEAR